MAENEAWWQCGVIYQLLVPTFFDTTGDGLGDLPGVISKLDYLNWLGVDAVWLSPIYDSPFMEMGYDPSDYKQINERFGTMEDFDTLVREAHHRDLKVILDWIPNHTSSQHPWFEASRSSRDNPQRDWYIWRDPKSDGSPPNNWLSIFGGSVWEFDEGTGQYYLHTFLPEQPDLNWWNPDVRAAVFDAMRFWLDRDVDGFRLDALDLLVKNPEFPDNPPNPDYNPEVDGPDMAVLPIHTRNQPAVHDFVAEMRQLVDEYGDRLLAGELYVSLDDLVQFYGENRPELHLPLYPSFGSTPWSAETLHGAIDGMLCRIPEGAWPSWMMSSHDGRRVASRAGNDQAGVAAMMHLTLRGTPIIYYGDEIGMHDVPVPPEKEKDPQGMRIGRKRDPVRTPMQWNDWQNAGFTTTEPWLPVAEDYPEINVDVQNEGRTLLTLYRRLLALRREGTTLVHGSCSVHPPEGNVISYDRSGDGRRLLILLNLGNEPQSAARSEGGGRILLSTCMDRDGEQVSGAVELRGNEGLILET